MTTRQDILQLFITLTAIASLFLGAGGLIMHARLGQMAGQPSFVSPYFSIALMVCGLCLFAARTYPRYSRLLAIFVILVIGLARTAHLFSDTWINTREISANFATGLVLAGALATLVYKHIFRPPRNLASRKDFVFAVMGVAASTFIAYALIEDNILTRQRIASASASAITSDLTQHYSQDSHEGSPLYQSDILLVTEVRADFVWLAGILFTLFLISGRRLTELARRHAVQLSHNALHDPLTGLPNRRILEQALTEACGQAKRRRQSVSVVFFEVEGIKLVNDSIGHDRGDEVVIEVANRLSKCRLEGSTVAQLNGNEFVLVLVELEPRQVQEHTQHVIDELSRPYHVDGRTLTMAVGAGIVHSDGHLTDAMELVRRADLAMLEAKKEDKNTWHTYTDDLSTRISERIELRHDLQTALDTDGLELVYQPIIEGLSGRVLGLEALTRWRHDRRGYISPARFISLAEETGQIIPLTRWSLYTACRDGVRLRKTGLPPFPVIVNISPLYFQKPEFIDNVKSVLRDTGLPPEFLELEITESLLLDDAKQSVVKLTQLQNMGIRVSIDDFGTGYSSLSYLKKLPIDKVKIDRSFVTDLVDDPADAAITQAIISMAHHLNLRVVAEGVETVAQLAFLRRRNCDAFQGYLFAKPMPLETLVAQLLKSHGYVFPSKHSADRARHETT